MLRKIVIVSGLAIALAVPALAQGPQRGRDRNIDRIQRALNLTPDQVNSLQALIQSQRPAMESIAKDVRDKAQALRELQRQPNPNPTDAGNAMLALRAARERIRAERQRFEESLRNLLTTDQREKLDRMKQRGRTLLGRLGARRNAR